MEKSQGLKKIMRGKEEEDQIWTVHDWAWRMFVSLLHMKPEGNCGKQPDRKAACFPQTQTIDLSHKSDIKHRIMPGNYSPPVSSPLPASGPVCAACSFTSGASDQ